MNYKYFENKDSKLSDIIKVQDILKAENVILDSKYLIVIEQAENGNFGAIAEMSTVFCNGIEGVKPNYNLAKRYTLKGLEIVKTSENKDSILEVLTNLAVLESKFGNDENAKNNLKEAFELTLNNYPLDDIIGNFSNLFHFIASDEDDESET